MSTCTWVGVLLWRRIKVPPLLTNTQEEGGQLRRNSNCNILILEFPHFIRVDSIARRDSGWSTESFFWLKINFFSRYTHISSVFGARTDPTQLDHISPMAPYPEATLYTFGFPVGGAIWPIDGPFFGPNSWKWPLTGPTMQKWPNIHFFWDLSWKAC